MRTRFFFLNFQNHPLYPVGRALSESHFGSQLQVSLWRLKTLLPHCHHQPTYLRSQPCLSTFMAQQWTRLPATAADHWARGRGWDSYSSTVLSSSPGGSLLWGHLLFNAVRVFASAKLEIKSKHPPK